MKHNADGIACFMSQAYPYMKEKYAITHVEVFSDCCAGQYRSAKSFADLSDHPSKYKTTIAHNYFEASHGKSSADGAVVKHAATYAVTRRQHTIRNAAELYQFCMTSNTSEVGPSNSSRTFFYVPKESVLRNRRDVKTVAGCSLCMFTVHRQLGFQLK